MIEVMEQNPPHVSRDPCGNTLGLLFWAEAMSTATYLVNRLLSSSINDAIPYELWHSKVLTSKELKLLKPSGCMVHAHVPEERCKPLSKVDARSTVGCFIGYHISLSHK